MAAGWDFVTVWKEHTLTDNPPEDYPTFLISSPVNGSGLCKYLSSGVVRKLVYSVIGASHLDGQLVSVAGDGVVATPAKQFVAGGTINLTVPAATIHVGLNYKWKLKFLPLGGDGQTVNQGKERKLYDIVLRVWESLGGNFGQDEDNLYPLVMPSSADPLYTGDIHGVGIDSQWDDYCMPVLTGSDPVPFMLLAAIMRSEISEDK